MVFLGDVDSGDGGALSEGELGGAVEARFSGDDPSLWLRCAAGGFWTERIAPRQ